MKRVSILLVNWNGWEDTLECLESLFRLDYQDFRVIVCDNQSTDDSLQKIKAWADGAEPSRQETPAVLHDLTAPPVPKPINWVHLDRTEAEQGGHPESDPELVLISTGGNLGFAGGCNVGLRYFLSREDADYVWLLNNDTIVKSDSLAQLVDTMVGHPRVGLCGSTLLHYDAPDKIQALGGGYLCPWIALPWLFGRWRRLQEKHLEETRVPRLMNYVVGASMLVSRAFVQQVGLMKEDYFLYFEETDWAFRGRRYFDLGWASRSLVYHKVGSSIGTSSDPRLKSATCDYYALRNRLIFTRRFCRPALPIVWLTLFGAMLLRFASGRKDLGLQTWKILTGQPGQAPETVTR